MAEIIVLEGQDGVGKSSVAKQLLAIMNEDGNRCLLVREPGGTPAGERIRDVLLNQKLDPYSQFYLFQAARIELLNALAKERDNYDYIIMDRYWPSTLAYQVYGDGVDYDLFNEALAHTNNLQNRIGPARIFLLTAPEDVRQERIEQSGKGSDQFEKRGADYYERVRKGYEYVAMKDGVTPITTNKAPVYVAEYIRIVVTR